MMNMTLFDEIAPHPRVRIDDPSTSREAAESLEPGNDDIVRAIRRYVGNVGWVSQEEIADAIAIKHGERWTRGSVVSACARAGLEETGIETLNRRGRKVKTWRLRTLPVDPGEYL